jgi:hypothetical protein
MDPSLTMAFFMTMLKKEMRIRKKEQKRERKKLEG